MRAEHRVRLDGQMFLSPALCVFEFAIQFMKTRWGITPNGGSFVVAWLSMPKWRCAEAAGQGGPQSQINTWRAS